MASNLSLEELTELVSSGEIDTVLACQVDMQGRLMGKRFHAKYFLDSAVDETHSCNYLLATDIEMDTVEGYKASSWRQGYGDYIMKPDLSTLRLTPWLEGTALVICDVLDPNSHEEITHSPRTILQKQISRLEQMGFKAMMASELEFFLFKDSFEEALEKRYTELQTISAYNEDYHIFQTSKEEDVMRDLRNGLYGAGIVVECSKGEASAGQEEINIKYDQALTASDHHVITKNACKEIAWSKGKSVTFMAKWNDEAAGNSSHIHQSLQALNGKAVFFDQNAKHGMSDVMCHYVAGLLKYASEITYFLAPNINSYKRFVSGTFAPTKAVWSLDNRTAGYRLCGANTDAVRIECRVGGGDLNPYLAFAAQLSAGIKGIEEKLPLPPEFVGDAYNPKEKIQEIPKTLRSAIDLLDKSKMLRDAFSDDVVDHYVHAGRHEQSEYDKKVTDWEIMRGFERT